MRVLIVDDDLKRATSLSYHLTESLTCISVVVVDCVQAAKQRLKNSYFDALVLDVVLPKRPGEKADPANGVNLLRDINRNSLYVKPERVIGISAHIDDLPSFRASFESFCFAVVEASPTSAHWRAKISDAIAYTSTSKAVRAIRASNLHGLTVHGIQTFGGWQKRLSALAVDAFGDIPFHTYKYGLFSIPAFFIPFMRRREVIRLEKHLESVFAANVGARYVVFCHSFGTYIVAYALRRLVERGVEAPIETLVMGGSVLPSRFDLSYLHSKGIRVINDCADHDYVLYLSQLFVVGCGMAGKCGFYGMDNETGVNRFFLGGHSSYFDGDAFMNKYWLPLFSKDLVDAVDLRISSVLRHLVIDKVIIGLGTLMPIAYVAAAGYFLWRLGQ